MSSLGRSKPLSYIFARCYQGLGIIQCRHGSVPFFNPNGSTEYFTGDPAKSQSICQYRGVLSALCQQQWISPLVYLSNNVLDNPVIPSRYLARASLNNAS